MSTTTHATPAQALTANAAAAEPAPRDDADPFDRRSAFVRPADSQDADTPGVPDATVTVTGRNVEIPDHFRVHVGDKLSRVERYDPTIFAFDVELHHERNRRQSKVCQRLEITARGRGPVVRAEACAENFYAALEIAVDRLQSRLRRTKDRRKVHHGTRTPISVAQATADLEPVNGRADSAPAPDWAADVPDADGPGQVVRIKDHEAVPMTVDDALYEMELVGHDFFLFHDKESDRPSVVYRRHAFDYGLIRLA